MLHKINLQMNKLLPVMIALLCHITANAQTGKFFNNDQLSSSFVTQVYVDREGFLWITTRDGINRYDGYQFREFNNQNDADSTLTSNYVNCMVQDSTGRFYFGMYGALQSWDGSRFHDVSMLNLQGEPSYCYATCLLQRRNGDLIAGTSGLGVMRFENPQTARQIGGMLSALHTVNSMLEDSQGRLWMTTDRHGLVCFDGEKATHYLTTRNDLYGLCEDQEGRIYVGTSNAGVYQQQGNSFEHIEATGSKAVSALYCGHDGHIYIGYDGEGLAIYAPETRQLTDNPFFSLEVDLAKSKVASLTEDQNGNLWIGMMQKGIYKQPITQHGFHYTGHRLGPQNIIGNAFIICTFFDRQGRTWVGTDKDGLYCVSPSRQDARHLRQGYPSVVMAIAEDANGRIWVGSYQEGFGWIDPTTMEYHRQPYPADDHLIVMDIQIDSHGKMWMATMKHGVLCMNLADGNIKKYAADPLAPSNRQVNSIANDYVSQLALSPDEQHLYVSTSMGLCCLDIASGSWTNAFGGNSLYYGTPVRFVRQVGDRLWVGSNQGLWCLDAAGNELKRYTREQGLCDNGVASIEPDAQGRLWIGTNHGLCCLNPSNDAIQNYYVDDGLQSNEFGDNSSCQTPDGTIIMGGTGGLTWFNPASIEHSEWRAQVQLTGFFINGQPVNRATLSGGRPVVDTTIIASNHFHLSYQDNSIAVQLSTLTFDNPEHTTYLYSINGEPFNRLQQGTNMLSLSHMSPGTYRFRVKAERWGTPTVSERTFTVHIGAPWYRSTWAYIFYALALLGVVAVFRYDRRRKEQERLRLQEHIHAEEMADAKLRFFMNISHEIRTPMTLIATPLMSLLKNESDPQRRSTYETMQRNANRILALINQMMDLRKIDKGQMQMRMAETDLVAFVNDVHSLFKHQAAARHLSLQFTHDCEQLHVWIDRQHFDKVIVNLLSNAFKFTPAGGHVNISIDHDESHARIIISDDGEKIPEDKLERIFERFYQSPSKVNDRNVGTGIGLDLTRALVELHHGTISAQNLEQGCQFTVVLPLGNAHLKPEEMTTETEQPQSEAIAEQEAMENEQELLKYEQENGKDAPQRGANERKVIVIAEDDDEIRQFLTTELGTHYDVHACNNGREALGEVYRSHPDLIISDIMMPEMDGYTLCTRLKSNASTNFIPIILLTAKNRDEDKLEGLETGADVYMAKPFNIDILRRTVLNLINAHQLMRIKYSRSDQLEKLIDDVQVPKSPDEKLLDRLMATVNKHLDDSELNVDMIADEVGISRVHLHRKMKELTGQTPHDFIRNLRLKRAATLLATQSMNVTEVMYACGFANATSFSTIFKKFYGMTPRDYMREHEKRS